MDIKAIFEGKATVDELQELHEKKGVEVVIENGQASEVIM